VKKLASILLVLLLVGLIMPAGAAPDRLLADFDGRIRVYRLARPVFHDNMWDTHILWMDGDKYLINAADADYLRRCMDMVVEDVIRNDLYNAGRGKIWDLRYNQPKRGP
jgi:hypothetical protein